jgi:uncharacterized protein (DUF1778 family)
MAKSKKNKNKAKLNLTVRDEQRNKLEQMASLENRSVSNLIEVMADERWKRLAEEQGVAYAKTVAEAMELKLDMDTMGEKTAGQQRVSRIFGQPPAETAQCAGAGKDEEMKIEWRDRLETVVMKETT